MGGRRRRPRLPRGLFEARIESLSHDGRGVARIDGKTIFIHGALPGEIVRFTYTGRWRKYDEGIAQEIIQASPERVMPRCPHFGLCGGCRLQHQASEAQILHKQHALLESLLHIGKVEPEQVLPPLRNAQPWGYRRKARLGVRYVHAKKRVLVGFRERGSNFIADLESCAVLHPKIGCRIQDLARLIETLSIFEQIPQIEVAMDDTRCVLIFRVLALPSESDKAKLRAFATAWGFHIYLQSGGADTVIPLDAEQHVELAYRLPDFNLEIGFGPLDFTQVNTEINRQMVSRAIDLLAPEADDRLLDLFCGVGNFTLPLAKYAKMVGGVEGAPALVAKAQQNAQYNGLSNIEFHVANLYEELEERPWVRQTYDKALLDPPRSGAWEVLPWLPKWGVQRLLYVSCYPGTLARDAGALVHQYGYRLRVAGVMDMFPHTAHVESMALFTRE